MFVSVLKFDLIIIVGCSTVHSHYWLIFVDDCFETTFVSECFFCQFWLLFFFNPIFHFLPLSVFLRNLFFFWAFPSSHQRFLAFVECLEMFESTLLIKFFCFSSICLWFLSMILEWRLRSLTTDLDSFWSELIWPESFDKFLLSWFLNCFYFEILFGQFLFPGLSKKIYLLVELTSIILSDLISQLSVLKGNLFCVQVLFLLIVNCFSVFSSLYFWLSSWVTKFFSFLLAGEEI